MRLTEKIVATSLYEGRSHMSRGGRKRWSQHVLWDDDLPGFGLRISSTNRKSYIVTYRTNGRKRTKTLGPADRLPLDEARQRAAEVLDAHAAEQPREAGDAPIEGVETVAQLADAYLERHLKVNVPSWFTDHRLMRTHINPALGRSPIAELSPTDIANLRSRVARTFPADARRLKTLLSGMFNWAAANGLWSKSSREDGSAAPQTAPRPEPQTEPEPALEPASLPSAAELQEALQRSEEQRRELAAHLEEVSASGAEMLTKLNEQAVAQKELAAELASSSRQLEQAEAAVASRPDPETVEKQMANLRLSVEQLMSSQDKAEDERGELAEKLVAAEAIASAQTKKVVALARLRNELESRVLEQERKAAIRKVQRRGTGRRRFVWLAAGVLGGALLVALLPFALGGGGATRTAADAEPTDEATSTASESPVAEVEAAPTAPPGTAPGAATTPAGETLSSTADGGELQPDPAAAEAAVRGWAAAWSEQRVADYLAAYSKQFVPPDGMRRGEWASQRQNRILRPTSIRVEVSPMSRTALGDDRVEISFEQSYETSTYADQVRKTLELVWEDGAWKILAERAG